MKIDDYSFGNISINGRKYTADLIICPDKIIFPWRRKNGHILQKEDLRDIIEFIPDVLVIGTGYYGRMKVSDAALRSVSEKGIKVHVQTTPEAVSLFNQISAKNKTIACLHLTC